MGNGLLVSSKIVSHNGGDNIIITSSVPSSHSFLAFQEIDRRDYKPNCKYKDVPTTDLVGVDFQGHLSEASLHDSWIEARPKEIATHCDWKLQQQWQQQQT